MNLAGKTALVTGGTDGIGAQLARQLRDKGVTVIATGRTPANIEATRAAGFETIAADLTQAAGIEALVAALGERPLDILVNNAGMGAEHDFRAGDPDPGDADRAIFLNLNAPIRLIAALMPVLGSRPEAMIVNVTSGLAIAPRAGGPVYCATKAGLRSYTQALRVQLKNTRIHVLEALPPVVETRMTAARSGSKMSSAQCARQIVSAMERGAAEANVGMVKLLQAIHSLSPALARRVMMGF